jgi:serine/threonine protein kinase
MQTARGQTAAQTQQQKKLLNSYQELLSVFESQELSSVGNYTLGRLIGKGSFGKVYLATHKLTNGSRVGVPFLAGVVCTERFE